MVQIAKRVKELPGTIMTRLLKIAEERKDIISLGPGEPDFCAPLPVLQATKKALDMCYTSYSSPQGRSDLKEAVCKKLKQNRISANPENIIITSGSQEAILLAYMCTLDVGEQALIPDPGYLGYRPIVEFLGGWPVPIPLKESEKWEINTDLIPKLMDSKKVKFLMLNTPANPTGNVLKKKTLEKLADLAVEHDFYIFSDEAYEKFVYGDAKHVSIGSLNGLQDRVVTFQSFSKSWAMPGFRVGYAAGPQNLIDAMVQVHNYTTICAPTISQFGAIKALQTPAEAEKMKKEYDRRRKFIVKRLNEIGLRTVMPEGAFYAFSNIQKFSKSSIKFSEMLLKKAKVAVVPGTEFGKYGEGYVRFSYATAYALIEKAMDRIEKVLT